MKKIKNDGDGDIKCIPCNGLKALENIINMHCSTDDPETMDKKDWEILKAHFYQWGANID